jgi:hypothetical protein
MAAPPVAAAPMDQAPLRLLPRLLLLWQLLPWLLLLWRLLPLLLHPSGAAVWLLLPWWLLGPLILRLLLLQMLLLWLLTWLPLSCQQDLSRCIRIFVLYPSKTVNLYISIFKNSLSTELRHIILDWIWKADMQVVTTILKWKCFILVRSLSAEFANRNSDPLSWLNWF